MAESIAPTIVELTINNNESVAADANINLVSAKMQVVDGVLRADDRQTYPGVMQ